MAKSNPVPPAAPPVRFDANRATWPRPGPPSATASRPATAPPAGGTFSPQRTPLRLDNHGYSPAALRLIVQLAARLGSFADAAFALTQTGLPISAQHVRTLAGLVGAELVGQRDRKAGLSRSKVPVRVAATPGVVAVEVDGGRLRTCATDAGPGVHAAQNKEDKIACLVSLESKVSAQDPQPEPPPSFLLPRRVERLVQQMAGQAGEAADTAGPLENQARQPADRRDTEDESWPPRKRVRTCVASMANSRAFGRMVAVEAKERDFYRAQRKAFVADGAAYNWKLQQRTSRTSCRSPTSCTCSATCTGRRGRWRPRRPSAGTNTWRWLRRAGRAGWRR